MPPLPTAPLPVPLRPPPARRARRTRRCRRLRRTRRPSKRSTRRSIACSRSQCRSKFRAFDVNVKRRGSYRGAFLWGVTTLLVHVTFVIGSCISVPNECRTPCKAAAKCLEEEELAALHPSVPYPDIEGQR